MSDDDLVRRLRITTQELGTSTLVTKEMWQNHSSACFEAADYIEHCHASHDAMTKEIEWLKRERDEYYADREHFTKLAFVDLGANPPIAWEDRANAAERKVEKLREAMRPFADRLTALERMPTAVKYAVATDIAVDDLRRARAALAETEKGDE